MESTADRLNALAEGLRRFNPGARFVVDGLGVWLRRGGVEYGIYGAYLDGTIRLLLADGQTISQSRGLE